MIDMGALVGTPKLWLKTNTSLLFGAAFEAPIESRNCSSVGFVALRRLNPFNRALGATPIPPTLFFAIAMRPATLVPWSVVAVLVGSVVPVLKFHDPAGITLGDRSSCRISSPESTTATVTPAPV